MRELTFTVNIDEANLILEGLGNLPFVSVYGLVAKIQRQVRAQLSGPERGEGMSLPRAEEG